MTKQTLSQRLEKWAIEADRYCQPNAAATLYEAKDAIDEATATMNHLKNLYPASPHILTIADNALSKLTKEL